MNSCLLWHPPHRVWHPLACLGWIPLIPNALSLLPPYCLLSWSPSELSPCSDTPIQPVPTSGIQTETKTQHISWGQVPHLSKLQVFRVSVRSPLHGLSSKKKAFLHVVVFSSLWEWCLVYWEGCDTSCYNKWLPHDELHTWVYVITLLWVSHLDL